MRRTGQAPDVLDLLSRPRAGERTIGWRFVEQRLMLRGNGPDSWPRKRQGRDWHVGAGKGAWSTATEAVFGRIEQAVRVR